MSNLKVNSKSSVLEHKRKHNLLVDKMVEEFAKIPELVDAKISSDKEIISKIEISEDGNTLTFPEHILPVVFYDDLIQEAIYFDYVDAQGKYNDGSVYGNISVEDNKVSLTNSEYEFETLTNSDLVYSLFDDNVSPLNFLNLYKDIPTTQLYKHTITHVYEYEEVDGEGTLEVISNIATEPANSQAFINLLNTAIKITPIDVNGDFEDLIVVFNAHSGIWQGNFVNTLSFGRLDSAEDTIEKI